MTQTAVTDNPTDSRYEIRLDGELAGFIDYAIDGEVIDMIHTEVFDEHQGKGVAGDLAGEALADAVGRGLRIVPSCPYIARYLDRHEVPGAQVDQA